MNHAINLNSPIGENYMDIRKVGKMKKGSVKYITLPSDWAEAGEYVDVEVVDEKSLKIVKINRG